MGVEIAQVIEAAVAANGGANMEVTHVETTYAEPTKVESTKAGTRDLEMTEVETREVEDNREFGRNKFGSPPDHSSVTFTENGADTVGTNVLSIFS